jgi:hypothetical protein
VQINPTYAGWLSEQMAAPVGLTPKSNNAPKKLTLDAHDHHRGSKMLADLAR